MSPPSWSLCAPRPAECFAQAGMPLLRPGPRTQASESNAPCCVFKVPRTGQDLDGACSTSQKPKLSAHCQSQTHHNKKNTSGTTIDTTTQKNTAYIKTNTEQSRRPSASWWDGITSPFPAVTSVVRCVITCHVPCHEGHTRTARRGVPLTGQGHRTYDHKVFPLQLMVDTRQMKISLTRAHAQARRDQFSNMTENR